MYPRQSIWLLQVENICSSSDLHRARSAQAPTPATSNSRRVSATEEKLIKQGGAVGMNLEYLPYFALVAVLNIG